MRIHRGEAFDPKEIQEAFRGVLEVHLAEIATEEGIRIGESGVSFDPAAVNSEAVAWARRYSFQLVNELTDTTKEIISGAVEKFFSTPGMTVGSLETLLEPAFSKVRAESIAVTETTRAFSQAQNAYQKQLSDEGVQMHRVWHTAHDELVCPLCGPMNGKSEDDWKGEFPDGPPRHPRCRCSTTLTVNPE